ncbi:hypothetical protein GCM10009609_07720 [Pseudonocardia aurantiaca]
MPSFISGLLANSWAIPFLLLAWVVLGGLVLLAFGRSRQQVGEWAEDWLSRPSRHRRRTCARTASRPRAGRASPTPAGRGERG